MYEIKIPKNELEDYDSDESLGLMVGGYGRKAFPNNSYWVFSQTDLNLIPELSSRYLHMLCKDVKRSPLIPLFMVIKSILYYSLPD